MRKFLDPPSVIAVRPGGPRGVQGRGDQAGAEAPDDVHRVVGQDAGGRAVRLRGARREGYPDARALGDVLRQEEEHPGRRGRRRRHGILRMFLLLTTVPSPFYAT